jgi:transposase
MDGMPRGYSRDLRERLVHAVTSGQAPAEVARTMGVSVSSVRRYVRTAAAGRSLESGRSSGGPRKIPAADEDALRAQAAAAPDATLAEPCATWAAAGHRAVSVATMHRALGRLGLTRNK